MIYARETTGYLGLYRVRLATAKSLNEFALHLGSAIRNVIPPGEMKDLMNRVTEAKKAAEANLIARREETAAMRSQVNTAKLLADNPTLMRLRELEVLEKVAANSKLNILLGDVSLDKCARQHDSRTDRRCYAGGVRSADLTPRAAPRDGRENPAPPGQLVATPGPHGRRGLPDR